jgi:FMN reductase
MTETIRVVALVGTLHTPSKTGVLVDDILRRIDGRQSADSTVVDVLQHGHALIDALGGEVSDPLRRAFDAVLAADLLIVATPVYKGSYTGLLKLFVDLLPQDGLAGLPVLPVAVGGSDVHSLMIDHELRPLFAFFGADSLPDGIWARSADIALDGTVAESLAATVEKAVVAALPAASRRRAR